MLGKKSLKIKKEKSVSLLCSDWVVWDRAAAEAAWVEAPEEAGETQEATSPT